jgi:hypothetical protein
MAAASTGPISKGDFLKAHRTELLVGGAGLVAAIALYVKSKNSSSSSTSTTPASTTDEPVEYDGGGAGNGTGGGYGGELEEQIAALGQQLAAISPSGQLLNPVAGSLTGPSGTSAASQAAATSPGYGTIDIGGTDYIILGQPSTEDLYQVGGGAPVYFGNGNGVAQGSAAEQAALADGGYAYTPESDASLVSPTATQHL